MSTIKSFFDKYLPFPDHRKRKLSEDKPHDFAPKRKLPRLSQLSVVQQQQRPTTAAPADPIYRQLQQQYQYKQQALPPPALKPLLPKSRGFFGPSFSFRKTLPTACYSKHSSRYGMDSIELESEDDDVELVEFLQSRDMSPATFRKLSGRQNASRPLPELIPRYKTQTQPVMNGGSISSSSSSMSQMQHQQENNPSSNAYSLFKKRFNIASPQLRAPCNNNNNLRGHQMVNTALRKSFNQQEKQKYSDMWTGCGMLSAQRQQHRPAEGSLFGALQRSSILNRLPFSSSSSSTKDSNNINIGSRNKYGKLLAKFSSDMDTRRGGSMFRGNAVINQKPSVCVDLTKHNGNSSSRSKLATVELTDDEEEDEDNLDDDDSVVIDLEDGNEGSFKIPKSFPCADNHHQVQQVTGGVAVAASSSNSSSSINRHPPPLPSRQWTGMAEVDRHKQFLMALESHHNVDQDEDDDEDNNEAAGGSSIVLDDDDDEVDDQRSTSTTSRQNRQAEKFTPVNTLLDEWQTKPVFKDDWLEATRRRYSAKQEEWTMRIAEEQERQVAMDRESRQDVQEMIKKMDEALLLREVIVVEDEEAVAAANLAAAQEEKPKDTPLPSFTAEQMQTIRYAAGRGSPDEVLVTKFNLNITRRDIGTLMGDAWLNDEVINFYMNLLMERSEGGQGYPKVYAMNTFFMPKVLQQGQSGVRRWTRKADIFAYDVIPVPVHVSNIHWCMAIIHLKERWIRYYDSMGQPNRRVLDALEQYLKDESMDKRKVAFSTEGWVKESVADCPRQMNGSDCGVFSCMFAEYVARNHRINFTQDNMPYFRQKMVLEICTGKLVL